MLYLLRKGLHTKEKRGSVVMINVYLCDDNKEMIEFYSELLKKISYKNNIEINIEAFSSGENLLFEIEETISDTDIIYLDIEMEGINGIETAAKLRELGYKSEIIFITSCREYVFDAFDSSPLNYIVKGENNREKFEDVFLKATRLVGERGKSSLVYKNGSETRKIKVDDIAYFEVVSRVVYVHYGKDEEFRFYSSINAVVNSVLNYSFKRVHRSFVVNMKYIQSIKDKSLFLTNGVEIPIGKTYLKEVQEHFSTFLMEKIDF